MVSGGTRWWDGRPHGQASLERLKRWLERATSLFDQTIVAINPADNSGALEYLDGLGMGPSLKAFVVEPWGYAKAMNALVDAAAENHNYLLSQSIEIEIARWQLERLLEQIESDQRVLVVGARLPGHNFFPGKKNVVGDGATTPWNTLALWRLIKLAALGFPLVSDGFFDRSMAGVEEYAALAILQALFPNESEAILIELEGVVWDTRFEGDLARRLLHEKKMRLKVIRALCQAGLLGKIRKPMIRHVGRIEVPQPRIVVPDLQIVVPRSGRL